jgi:hypothetical protein
MSQRLEHGTFYDAAVRSVDPRGSRHDSAEGVCEVRGRSPWCYDALEQSHIEAAREVAKP